MDVIGADERFRAERMSVGHGDFVRELFTVIENDFHATAKSLFIWIGRMIASGPFSIFRRPNFMPEDNHVRVSGNFRRITFNVMPEAGVQRRREDEHDAVVECLAAGVGIGFLRIARAGADDEMMTAPRVIGSGAAVGSQRAAEFRRRERGHRGRADPDR